MSALGMDSVVARDRAISQVWQRCASGEITFDEAARIVGGEANCTKDELAKLATSNDRTHPRRGRSTRTDAEREERLKARKALAAGALPADVVRKGNLTVADQAVAAVIARLCRMGKCTAAVETIARMAYVSVRSAQLAIAKLDKHELIARLARPIACRKNDTNLVVITCRRWLAYIKEMAVLRRFHRVQKSEGEQDCKNNLVNITTKNGLPVRSRFQPLTGKAAAWLRPFRETAGACLNPTAVLLHDPGPLTRLFVGGATFADVIAGIQKVALRHERSGRVGDVSSWKYFAPAIAAASERRRTSP